MLVVARSSGTTMATLCPEQLWISTPTTNGNRGASSMPLVRELPSTEVYLTLTLSFCSQFLQEPKEC
jgi:hypothetical protein